MFFLVLSTVCFAGAESYLLFRTNPSCKKDNFLVNGRYFLSFKHLVRWEDWFAMVFAAVWRVFR